MKYYKKKSNKFLYIVSVFIVLFIICPICCTHSFTVSADSKQYTNVLEDLQKDSNFNVNDYPAIDNDYSLKVIQIAESVDNELFIYVYQPSGEKVQASSIRISTAINDSFSPKDYDLSKINSNGVFYKYKVNNFIILQDALRYYSIVSIFRPFDKNLDENLNNDNTINEVSYEIAKLFTATTVEGKVTYTCLETETILITSKYVGFIRYDNGFTLHNKYCDSHFVAFSTDMPMDKLMEAEVSFVHRDIVERINLTGDHPYSQGEYVSDTVLLSDIDTAHSSAHGWFATKYEWQRIEKVSDFIEKEDLTTSVINSINDMDWVLRFYESDVNETTSGTYAFRESEEVSEVTILRLKFETDGVVYNLGVVDNKQSGSTSPSNETTSWLDNVKSWLEKFWDKLSQIGKVILIVILTIVSLPLILIILKIIISLIKFIIDLFKK